MLAEMGFLPTVEASQRVLVGLVRGSCPVTADRDLSRGVAEFSKITGFASVLTGLAQAV
jgi:hypothetical protein